jgi:hypothetical protein
VAYANSFVVMGFILAAGRLRPEWLRPTPWPEIRTAGAILWLVGAVLCLWPLWYLRRSFSLEPEARNLVTAGPYRWARHPIYTVYLSHQPGILPGTSPFCFAVGAGVALLLIRTARGGGPRVGLSRISEYRQSALRGRPMSRRARPSLFDIIFIIWVIVVPVGFGSRLINSDGDMARHVRLGEVILDTGALPRVDTFSHTMAGQPFIAFEWGSEVVYALAYRAAGLPGVAVLAGLVLALTYALVAASARGDLLLAYFVSMAAAVLSGPTGLPGPIFTMLATVLLLAC